MGLFGDKSGMTVALDRADVMAGETVHVRVGIGAVDKKAQSARVELLYRNTYRYEGRDSDGDRTTTSTTVDVIVQSVPLHGGGVPQAGEAHVPLTIPPEAPGTATKSIEWQVRAVVDRRMGADDKQSAPLVVRAPAAPLATWAAAPPAIPAECGLSFEVARYALPGAVLQGTLGLRTAASISAKSLEVRLRRVRYDHDGLRDESTERKVVLLQGVEMQQGAVHSLPFTIDVPPDAPPSFHAHHNSQHWYLDAVFNRSMRSDITGSVEIVVHTI